MINLSYLELIQIIIILLQNYLYTVSSILIYGGFFIEDIYFLIANYFGIFTLINLLFILSNYMKQIFYEKNYKNNLISKKKLYIINKMSNDIVNKSINNSIKNIIFKENYKIVLSEMEHKNNFIPIKKNIILLNKFKSFFKNKDILILEFENLIVDLNGNIINDEVNNFFINLTRYCKKNHIQVGIISNIQPYNILAILSQIFDKEEHIYNLNNIITPYHFQKRKNKYEKINNNLIRGNKNTSVPNKKFLVDHIINFYNIIKNKIIFIGSDMECIGLLSKENIFSVGLLDQYLNNDTFIKINNKIN